MSIAGPVKTDADSFDESSLITKTLLSLEHRHPFANNEDPPFETLLSSEHRYHFEPDAFSTRTLLSYEHRHHL